MSAPIVIRSFCRHGVMDDDVDSNRDRWQGGWQKKTGKIGCVNLAVHLTSYASLESIAVRPRLEDWPVLRVFAILSIPGLSKQLLGIL